MNSIFIIILLALSISAYSSVELSPKNYEETHEVLLNPYRGFFKQIGSRNKIVSPKYINKASTLEKNKWEPEKEATVYRVNIPISKFKNSAIDQQFLSSLNSFFRNVEEKQISLILKFYYFWGNRAAQDKSLCYTKKGCLTSPSEKLILKHIQQLSDVINKYKHLILYVEAGLIGAYGEWHSDQYGNSKHWHPFRKKILDHWLRFLNRDLYITLRYPVDIRRAALRSHKRVGLQHDCPNYKYDTYPSELAHNLTHTKPMGGEVCKNPSRTTDASDTKVDFDKFYGCKIMMNYFDKYNFDVLNAGDWSGAISRFRKQNCLKEIRDKLGYRFLIKGSKYKPPFLYFSIENVGWGKLLKKQIVQIQVGDRIVKTKIDPRKWLKGKRYTEKVNIGISDLPFVKIQFEDDIRFANKQGNRIFLH